MKLLKYGKHYDLYIEVNNYLFFLNKVCDDYREIRRFSYRLCYLFEKLNELSFDDDENSLLYLRNKRRSLQYAKEVKKNIKKIKEYDLSVFDKASKRLVRNNLDVYDDSLRDYSRYIGVEPEKLVRVLSGDLSNLFSNKRLLKMQKHAAEVTEEKKNIEKVSEVKKNIEIEKKDMTDVSFNESADVIYNKRLLDKKELEQLKKEIDSGNSLFINLNNVAYEQRDIINDYILISRELNDFSFKIDQFNGNESNFSVMDLYRNLYSIAGSIVNSMFETVMHLSKVVSGNVLNYVMDRSVIDVFDTSDVFLTQVEDNFNKIESKFSNRLSNSEKNELKQELWHRYKLCGVTAFDIRETVSFDVLAFIIENPFTLFQTIRPNESNKGIFKKYDLSILLEFVIPEIVGTTVHVVKSLEQSINENKEFSENDKVSVLSYIKEIFSQKYVADLGVDQMSPLAYDYFVSFVVNKVYSNNKSFSEIKALRNDLIDKIYDEYMFQYKSVSLFDRLFGDALKPNYNEIRESIISFENKLLRNALKSNN